MANQLVYFIKAKDKDLFKIGYTSSNVNDRVKAINVGCPYDVALYATIPAVDNTEKSIHEQLTRYHLKGEWFEVSLSVINMLLMNVQGCWFASDKIDYKRLSPDRKPVGKRKKRKRRGRPSLKCEQCGGVKGKRGKYCNAACRQKAWRERQKAA